MTAVSPTGAALVPVDIADLVADVAGPVLLPGDPAFSAEVGGFNLCNPVSPAVASAPRVPQMSLRPCAGRCGTGGRWPCRPPGTVCRARSTAPC